VQTDEPPAGRPERRAVVPEPVSTVPAVARPFQGRRAGLISRVLANTVDFGVVVAVLMAGYLAVAAALFLWKSWAFTFPTPSFLLMLVLGGVTAVLYLMVAWTTSGRSYGDHLLGLRVVGPRGRLRFAGALVRAILCVVFPIGVFWVALSGENRSLQDVVLRTSVVYDWLGGDDLPVPAQRTAG
jgi:RDD family